MGPNRAYKQQPLLRYSYLALPSLESQLGSFPPQPFRSGSAFDNLWYPGSLMFIPMGSICSEKFSGIAMTVPAILNEVLRL